MEPSPFCISAYSPVRPKRAKLSTAHLCAKHRAHTNKKPGTKPGFAQGSQYPAVGYILPNKGQKCKAHTISRVKIHPASINYCFLPLEEFYSPLETL
jgi:hypothetical protein